MMKSVMNEAPLLAALSDAQLERVIAHATTLNLDEAEWLFSQDDPATRFFFVQSGQMRLFRLSADGDEKVIEIIGAGQTFAEALLFMGTGRYPVCAAALSPTRLVAIDAADFAAMLRESPETCFALLGDLSRRLHALIAEIDGLTLVSATGRVARWLLFRLPAGPGRAGAGRTQVRDRLATVHQTGDLVAHHAAAGRGGRHRCRWPADQAVGSGSVAGIGG